VIVFFQKADTWGDAHEVGRGVFSLPPLIPTLFMGDAYHSRLRTQFSLELCFTIHNSPVAQLLKLNPVRVLVYC